MSSRVIAGTAKGKHLKLVPGDSTRPVMDKVKEALFSILAHDITDTSFLDLFGGTGAVGIEALSRGAAQALFVERNKLAYDTIMNNLKTTRLQKQADVQLIDAFELLQRKPNKPYDYIYIAPPQYDGLWLDTMRTLDENPAWLAPNTIVIVQIDPMEQEDALFRHMRDYDLRRYGNTILWFFETMVEAE